MSAHEPEGSGSGQQGAGNAPREVRLRLPKRDRVRARTRQFGLQGGDPVGQDGLLLLAGRVGRVQAAQAVGLEPGVRGGGKGSARRSAIAQREGLAEPPGIENDGRTGSSPWPRGAPPTGPAAASGRTRPLRRGSRASLPAGRPCVWRPRGRARRDVPKQPPLPPACKGRACETVSAAPAPQGQAWAGLTSSAPHTRRSSSPGPPLPAPGQPSGGRATSEAAPIRSAACFPRSWSRALRGRGRTPPKAAAGPCRARRAPGRATAPGARLWPRTVRARQHRRARQEASS